MGINVNILTINAGSSSLKCGLFATDTEQGSFEPLLSVSVTNLGQTTATVHIRVGDKEGSEQPLAANDLPATLDFVMDLVRANLAGGRLAAIGHRIVHGGPRYGAAQPITRQVEQELRSLTAYDPEHAPAELELIDLLKIRFPDIPHIACFDTSFFHDLPMVAQLLAVPRKYYHKGLRRYGFHGLSYEYLLYRFDEIAGEDAARGKVIFAHLGSGASLAATFEGKPVDTTMGFTPASGIMMSTRSGDIDPGVARFLHHQAGMSFEDYNHMVNFESGLLGVSELSADMLTLLNNETRDPQAAEAVALFCYQARKAIGALSASMNGLTSLVFSGGIGEQSAPIRSRICQKLGFLGIVIDEAKNERHQECISSEDSRVGVHVIPTDEAHTIASQVVTVINKQGASV